MRVTVIILCHQLPSNEAARNLPPLDSALASSLQASSFKLSPTGDSDLMSHVVVLTIVYCDEKKDDRTAVASGSDLDCSLFLDGDHAVSIAMRRSSRLLRHVLTSTQHGTGRQTHFSLERRHGISPRILIVPSSIR